MRIQSWPNLAQGFEIRPLSSVDAKGAESGGKDRQIRRPFPPDVQNPPHYTRLSLVSELRPMINDFDFAIPVDAYLIP